MDPPIERVASTIVHFPPAYLNRPPPPIPSNSGGGRQLLHVPLKRPPPSILSKVEPDLSSGAMSGLKSITIRYLPGAEGFLHAHGESPVVDIRPEGIFSLGVRISALRDGGAVNQQQRRARGWRWQLTPARAAWVLCLACLAWILRGLAPMLVPAGPQGVGPSCQANGSHINSQTVTFPLSRHVSDLLGETLKLATDVTFLGLSPHQHHRLLPGRDANGVETGGDQLQLERLWRGSLFNSATVPVVDGLCDLVANYYSADRDWPSGFHPPEVLAREELSRLCELAVESLQEADQAWHEARAAAGDLVLRSTRRCHSLGGEFTHAELHHMDDGAGLPPLPRWGGQPAGIWPHRKSARLDYSDPVWQRWLMDTTLENLFPPGLPPLPAGQVSLAVSRLRHASATALLNLVAIENATSTWLHGVTGHEASRCNKFRFHLTFLRHFCSCAWSEAEDIQEARELIRLTGRMRGYISVATEQAGVAARLAYETVSGWEGLQGALQTVKDGHLHDPTVQVAEQVGKSSPNADPRCAQQNDSASTMTTTKWAFEALGLLGTKVTAAALSADLGWQRVCNDEQALWNEGRGSRV